VVVRESCQWQLSRCMTFKRLAGAVFPIFRPNECLPCTPTLTHTSSPSVAYILTPVWVSVTSPRCLTLTPVSSSCSSSCCCCCCCRYCSEAFTPTSVFLCRFVFSPYSTDGPTAAMETDVLLLEVWNCGTVFRLIWDKPTLTLNSLSGCWRHFCSVPVIEIVTSY